MPDYPSLLGPVEEACRKGGAKALAMRPTMSWGVKQDGSIVTDADKAVETDLREVIAHISPGSAVWGEEFGFSPTGEDGLWLIDPIDGTSNFAYGQPLWGVSVGYFHDGALRLGAICVPELGWSLTAAHGHGAYLNGSRLSAVRQGRIEPHELVVLGDVAMAGRTDVAGKVRHLGSFVVEAAIFARQGVRALLTNGVRLYDAAAGIVAAREIGAEVLHLDGTPFVERDWLKDLKCPTFGFFPPDSGWTFRA